VPKKALKFTILLALFMIYVGGGQKGLAENIRIPSYEGKESKIAKKKSYI